VAPDFLDLAPRPGKPRTAGITHVLDPGIGGSAVADLLATTHDLIDIWKVGWGTAYVDHALPAKIAALTTGGVDLCLGGTLLEIAWAQGRAVECLAWAADAGFTHVEVSRGTVDMSLGKGHQAVMSVPYGTVRKVDGKVTLTNIKYYSADQISPPDGMKSVDWIRSGFKKK